jgi:hypothetical protein
VITHKKLSEKFRQTDVIEVLDVENLRVNFKEIDGDKIIVEDPSTSEEYKVPENILGFDKRFLENQSEDLEIILKISGEKMLSFSIPISVEGEIESFTGKEMAQLTNGITIKEIPNHCSVGDKILVRSDTCVYISKISD